MSYVKPAQTPPSAACDFHEGLAHYLRDSRAHAPPTGLTRSGPARLYADLVFNNIDAQVSPCFPTARALLGKRRWHLLIREFLAHHSCKTPYFHEIPEEFLRYLRSREPGQEKALPFLNELIHYEWSELVLSISADVPVDDVDTQGDLLGGIPVLNPILAISDYCYPVHRLTARSAKACLQPFPTHILSFRKADFAVAFLCLNSVTLELLSYLFDGRLTGFGAIQSTLQKLKLQSTDAAFNGGLRILEDLRAQGAIVGVRQENRAS